ncbi:MAG TPA: hypothetical protein PLC53_00180 [Bacilli bacterium]|nr:hypothetical protein [Bacilli bacterium]
MKNKNVFKVLGIMILAVFVLTWIIPSSTIGTSSITLGSITPTGFADVFSALEIILYYFATPSILILFVGMFYGVINKTGGYKALVDKMVSIFKKRKWLFLVLTVLFYGATTALTGIYLPMIIFIPFSIAVMLELKYKKLPSLLATVGSVIVGLTAELSSYTFESMTGAETNTYLWIKVALLVVSLALVVVYILKFGDKKVKKSKGKKKEEIEEVNDSMFVPEVRNTVKPQKTKGIGLLVVICLTFATIVLGLTVWSDNTVFSDFYTSVQSVQIGSFAIFDSILGTFETFGEWTFVSVYVTLALAIIVMAIVNKLTFKETVESAVEGASKVVKLAFVAALLSLVVIFTLNSGFLITIFNGLAKSGSLFGISVASFISAPFMVEQVYSAQYLIQIIYAITANDNLLELYGLIVQVAHGFGMLVAPSSVLLIISLLYVDEGYTNWVKYIWKVLAAIFVACVVALIVASII